MTGAGGQLEGSARDEARDIGVSAAAAAAAMIEHEDEPETAQPRQALDAFLETLTPFQREFYRAVLATAPYGGNDSTSRPVAVKHAPHEMAAMVHIVDTGHSSGFDAVYIGWREASGIVVRELVRARGYISYLEAHTEGDMLVLSYGTERAPRTMRLPLAELATIECEDLLDGSDRMLVEGHLEAMRRQPREQRKDVRHGFTVLASEKQPKAA